MDLPQLINIKENQVDYTDVISIVIDITTRAKLFVSVEIYFQGRPRRHLENAFYDVKDVKKSRQTGSDLLI